MPNGKSGRAADADFGKQLAEMATGDERAGRSAGTREGRERSSSPAGSGVTISRPSMATVRASAGGRHGERRRSSARKTAQGGCLAADRLPDCGRRRFAVAADFRNQPASRSGRGSRPGAAARSAMSIRSGGSGTACGPCRRCTRAWPTTSYADRCAARQHAGAPDIVAGAMRRTAQCRHNVPCQSGREGAERCRDARQLAARRLHRPSRNAPGAIDTAGASAGGRARRGGARTRADARVSGEAVGAPAEEAKLGVPHPIVVAARSKEEASGRRRDRQAGPCCPGGFADASPGSGGRIAAAGRAGRGRLRRCAAGRLRRQRSGAVGQRGIPVSASAAIVAGAADRRQDRGGHCLCQRASARRPVASLPATPTAQPLKVLTVQLHPAELGVVTIRIALKNDALELQIETDRRDTARLVHADRETLSSLLRSAGYSVETMTVRAVDPSSAPASLGVARFAGQRTAVAGRRIAAGCQALGWAGARRTGR